MSQQVTLNPEMGQPSSVHCKKPVLLVIPTIALRFEISTTPQSRIMRRNAAATTQPIRNLSTVPVRNNFLACALPCLALRSAGETAGSFPSRSLKDMSEAGNWVCLYGSVGCDLSRPCWADNPWSVFRSLTPDYTPGFPVSGFFLVLMYSQKSISVACCPVLSWHVFVLYE